MSSPWGAGLPAVQREPGQRKVSASDPGFRLARILAAMVREALEYEATEEERRRWQDDGAAANQR